MQEPSALSLLPPILVVVLAVFLRRPILSLLIGALFGLAMLGPTTVLSNFADISLKVMQDETIAWLILVCGGFGALIALLVRTGGASAFAEFALKFAKGQRSSLVMTFVLGVIIFIDDYLNALTVGETMKRITDKFKISREMLAYVVDLYADDLDRIAAEIHASRLTHGQSSSFQCYAKRSSGRLSESL